MNATKKPRPSPKAIRETILGAVDRCGFEGMPKPDLIAAAAELGMAGRRSGLAAVRDLIRAGLIVADTTPGMRGELSPLYRSAAAVEREVRFQAEANRRGLLRPRGIRVMGTCR
jgi:hypothetical protein